MSLPNIDRSTYQIVCVLLLKKNIVSQIPKAERISPFANFAIVFVLYDVFNPTRNAVGLNIHVGNKEHTNA